MKTLFLDEAKGAEAVQVLNAILELRSKQTSPSPFIMMEILMALSMLYFVQEDYQQVLYLLMFHYSVILVITQR